MKYYPDSCMTEYNLSNFLPYQVSALAGKLSRELEKRYNLDHNLTVPEWRVLFHLSQSGIIKMNKLLIKVDLHKSRVSRACKRLENSGLINRENNPADKRETFLSLTGKGEKLMSELKPIAVQYNEKLIQLLGSEGPAFTKGLKTLLESEEP